MPLKLPGLHIYRVGHDNHSTNNPASRPTMTFGGIEVHLGRRPPRIQERPQQLRTAVLRETTLQNSSGDPRATSAQLSPTSTKDNARDADDFESIHSVMYVPPAGDRSALQPGAVVQLTETNPADSSLELGLLQRWRDPQVAKVMMREIKTIDIAPGEPKTMYTFGLGGCIAVSILSKKQDGTISATLSHRPPEELDDQLQEIQHEIARHPASGSGAGREIVILAPGGYTGTGAGSQLQPAVTAELAELVRMLDAKLPGTKPTLVSYHPRRPNEQSDALVVDFPAKAGDPVLYKGIHNAQSGL